MSKKMVCSVGELFIFMLHLQLVASELPSDQVSVMTSVYEIIQKNTASSFVWNDVSKASNPCSWMGVVCSSDNSSINSISLKSSSISTHEFLPFLCNISKLEYLDVSNNQLSSIPDGFFTVCGGITGLKLLNFSGNQLVGYLPTFNGFEMLEQLDFSGNFLSGEISLQLDRLSSLKLLDISKNKFTGKIPTNLGKMNLLERLVLSASLFRGEIPVEITKYKNLTWIDFSENQLSGSIPIEFGEFTKLNTLLLSLNSLSGGIPSSISNITTLHRFAAHQNMFNGTIPLGITSFLSSLDLSYNNLRGSLPSDLLSGPNLQTLDLSFNKLEGPIPAITSTKLLRLRLGCNSLNGTIPFDSLRSHLGLMYLELDSNRLSGEIPSELGMSKNLSLLNLANNRLRGTLPPSLGNLTNLRVLSLQSNNLVGEIPPQILLLNKLGRLNIGRNSLNGSIPLPISRMQNLLYLDLHGNNLSGSIPNSIANLASLIELQLGNNQLNGRIPDMPETLQNSLNLSHNLFGGPIPDNLSSLQNLVVLDLSNNRLSGKIPYLLTGLRSLTQLLLRNNNLSGSVPEFGYHVEVDMMGNKDLIYPSPAIPRIRMKRKSLSIDSGLVIATASGFPVGLLISFIAILISRRYKSINGNLSTPKSIHTPNVDFKKAMEAVADHSNITLKTAFSTFYKAVMPSGATYLAKKINHTHNNIFQFPRHKQLVEELEDFGKLSNSNVMVPIAYVLTVRKAYLFYDFVRGTLHDVLHHRMGNKLDWPSRYNIAVGVSKGLAFVHECSSGPIILLDLCSKSILLKSLDEPQISDIELCRLIDSSNSGCSIGYFPPEYASTERVTAAGNVYSFGVVLLELLTGRPAVSEGDELAKWVLRISEWDEILDSNVSETSIVVRNQMLGVVEVALACISVSPEMRPNAVSVVQMLLNTRQIDVDIS